MVSRLFYYLTISFFTLGLLACGSDSSGPSEPDWVGTYDLQTVEGTEVPAVILQVGNDVLEIVSGSVRMNEDQTFSTNATYRLTEGSEVTTSTDSQNGSFTKNGSAVRFNYSDGTQDTGSLNGKVLTITSEGITFVFQK